MVRAGDYLLEVDGHPVDVLADRCSPSWQVCVPVSQYLLTLLI